MEPNFTLGIRSRIIEHFEEKGDCIIKKLFRSTSLVFVLVVLFVLAASAGDVCFAKSGKPNNKYLRLNPYVPNETIAPGFDDGQVFSLHVREKVSKKIAEDFDSWDAKGNVVFDRQRQCGFR